MSNKTHLGHQAKKRFGQNFLHNDAVISDIVDAINPEPGENLVEIGPGLGALTEPVIERAGQLSVVELEFPHSDFSHQNFVRQKKKPMCKGGEWNFTPSLNSDSFHDPLLSFVLWE